MQPKVKVVVYESEVDNSGKNHSTSTRNPVQTQETVYELSRSRRNEASFEAKAKRPTTKYKTKRKESRTLGFDAIGKLCRHGKDYLLFLAMERKKLICNSQSKD